MKLVLALTILGLIKVASADNTQLTQSGDDFELSVLQSSGDNLLQGSVIGDGHAVTVDQSGGAEATIDLRNSGGSIDFDLKQNDPTDSISVQHFCIEPNGCPIYIDQR